MGHGSWVMGHGSWVMGHGWKCELTPSLCDLLVVTARIAGRPQGRNRVGFSPGPCFRSLPTDKHRLGKEAFAEYLSKCFLPVSRQIAMKMTRKSILRRSKWPVRPCATLGCVVSGGGMKMPTSIAGRRSARWLKPCASAVGAKVGRLLSNLSNASNLIYS